MRLIMENITYNAGHNSIVDNVSLSFDKNKLYVIVGPSGAGKTTLLTLLNGIISPTRGSILFNGENIFTYDAPSYRSRVCLLFQEPLLISGNGLDNLMLPFSFKSNVKKTPSHEDVQKAISSCALTDNYLEKDIWTYSGGEKQRLSLARTLLLDPNVFLLDEPTSALDATSEKQIIKTLEHLKDNRIIICVSHSRQLISKADTIIFIKEGKINHISNSIEHESIERFLEGSK